MGFVLHPLDSQRANSISSGVGGVFKWEGSSFFFLKNFF